MWYIDPQNVTGGASDGAGTGSIEHPFRTWAALVDHLGGLGQPLRIFRSTSVVFLSDQTDSSDPIYIDLSFQGDVSFSLSGSLTEVATGTFTAGTTPQAGNSPWTAEDTALGAGGWTPYLDLILRDDTQSPPVFMVITATQLPSTRATVTTPAVQADPGLVGTGQPPIQGTIAPGDHYTILRPTRVNLLGIGSRGPIENFVEPLLEETTTFVVLSNLWASPLMAAPGTSFMSFASRGVVPIVAHECRFDGDLEAFGEEKSVVLVDCNMKGGLVAIAAKVFGGQIEDPNSFGVQLTQATLDMGVLLNGVSISVLRTRGSVVGNVGLLTPPGPAILLDRGGGLDLLDQGFGALLWGVPLAGNDFLRVSSGAVFAYQGSVAVNMPFCSGGAEFALGGRKTNARGFDPTQGAGATYSAAIPAVMTNLDVALPGGFGGAAIDPQNLAAIVPYGL